MQYVLFSCDRVRKTPRHGAYGVAMGGEEESEVWSYYAWVVKVPSVNKLTEGLNGLGQEGWDLSTSITTVKTWINLTGNDMVFVFKKRGAGHKPSFELGALLAGADPDTAY